MKRKSNGLVVGTILVLLVGALIFIQARNEVKPDDEAVPTSGSPDGHFKPAPSVDDALDQPGPVVKPQ